MSHNEYENYFAYRNVTKDDYTPYVHQYLQNRIRQEESILDLGCGYGQIASGLAKLGYTKVCVDDISEHALSYCDELGLCRHQNNQKYDVVIISHVLEHIPKSQVGDFLTQVKSLLAVGGRAYVIVPNAQALTGAYWYFEDYTHEFLFTTGSLRYLLMKNGATSIRYFDQQSLEGLSKIKAIIRKLFLEYIDYKAKLINKISGNYFHAGSENIYTFELKAEVRFND